MKRFVILVLIAILTSVSVNAQPTKFADKKVPPRRENLKDLPGKVTKIVLLGDNSIMDLMIKDAVDKGWYISPFEFCSLSDFAKYKCDTNYYFLIRVKGLHRKEKEPAMEFLSLIKGNPEANKDMKKMPDILTLPLIPIGDEEGRIFSFIPSYISIIQNHIQKVIDKNLYAYLGTSFYADAINHAKDKKILFLESDFAFPETAQDLSKDFSDKAQFVTQEAMEDSISKATPATLVSLVLAPNISQKGSYCYKMLISTDSRELYYYRKHKITKKNKAGFLKEDLKRMSIPFLVSNGK